MSHGTSPPFNQDPLDVLEWDEFAYLVPEVDSADALLPDDPGTAARLRELAATMSFDPSPTSRVPAPYTYLGQFIDHDITLTTAVTALSPDEKIGHPVVAPLPRSDVPGLLRNRRTSGFDLDVLYGLQPIPEELPLAVPFAGDMFVLGSVVNVGDRPPGKTADNDLPRVDDPGSPLHRRACIGDPRNDENTIVAQLHLGFLKFHNAVVRDGFAFDEARRLVTHHYQWLVLTDFLPRLCDPEVVRSVLQHGNRLYRPRGNEKFMPFEYAVAAYRFGHSMVRQSYDFNRNLPREPKPDGSVGSLDQLFRFTGRSGDMAGLDRLPENWIIEWEMMFADRALAIDTTLAPFMAALPRQPEPIDVMQVLAARNLLKGHLFSLPTGQALAAAVLPAAQCMTAAELQAACSTREVAAGVTQWDVLQRLGFADRTPLWFYLLAEASVKGGGQHLGPLGSLIVAETVVGLMRANPDSVLNKPFVPTLGSVPGRFDLQDLLIKAGVMTDRVA